MPNLKKVISLHQASQISGYHQDYLSALMRKGEMNGEKLGGNWFTTEDEVRNYIFKQKIRNKNWLIRYLLLSIKKINSSFVYALICIILISVGLYFYNQSEIQTQKINAQFSDINKSEMRPEIKELKF